LSAPIWRQLPDRKRCNLAVRRFCRACREAEISTPRATTAGIVIEGAVMKAAPATI
jgi:hypothetical protein